MWAAWYERTGSATEVLQVGRMDDPVPGPGEVLVRVRSSGVNPSDYKRRAGWRGLPEPPGPVVPHSDGAGVVVDVGEGVPAARIGERVWIFNAQVGSRLHGTAAELVALPSFQAPLLPDATSWDEGACLGTPACTAHLAVHAAGSVRGRSVLVAGGAGAVGNLAVQLARWEEAALVVATVSSEEKEIFARQAGADAVVNYRRQPVTDRVMELTEGRGVDLIIEVDLGANLAIDVACVSENGAIASYSSSSDTRPILPYYPLAFKGATLKLLQAARMPLDARRAAISDLSDLLGLGRLVIHIGASLPLERIAEAHDLAERGQVVGNVVVRPPPEA